MIPSNTAGAWRASTYATARALGVALTAAALTGCATCASNDSLLFATATKVGLDVSAVNGVPVAGVFGYKRFEGASIPADPDLDGCTADGRSGGAARSVYAGIDLSNTRGGGLNITQVFASGEAAEAQARDPKRGLSLIMSAAEVEARARGDR